MAREVLIRRVQRIGERWTAVYREDDGSSTRYTLTRAEYEALAQKGAGAPPNKSEGRFSDRQWQQAWVSGRLGAANAAVFNTPDGFLREGDAEERNGVLTIQTRKGPLTLDPEDYEWQGSKLVATRPEQWPKGYVLRADGVLEVDDVPQGRA